MDMRVELLRKLSAEELMLLDCGVGEDSGESLGLQGNPISPSNEHPGLISFRVDLLNLLAVQGTLKSLLQHHSSKASILRCSAAFTVQLSHPYMTTGKTIALTRRTFVGKVSAFEYAI